jgi:biotin carboxyl carrier protein
MPGKIVKIPVKKSDQVITGQTVIIVEAMKMQSEYKVKRDSIIKDILVKEGDNVEGNQTLIVLE